jgi:hypothetical protein
MMKGCGHHVIPYESGWCVMSELNRKVIAHFDSQDEAIAYASDCAMSSEGSVLLHSTTLGESMELSTVSLPQQDELPDLAHQGMLPQGLSDSVNGRQDQRDSFGSGSFDPLLGFDECYFEI